MGEVSPQLAPTGRVERAENAHISTDFVPTAFLLRCTPEFGGLPDCTRLGVSRLPVSRQPKPAVYPIAAAPVAPMASAMNSSGIIAPEDRAPCRPRLCVTMSSKLWNRNPPALVDGLHQTVHLKRLGRLAT